MLTIIHVIDSLGRGGAETLLNGTLEGLSATRNIVVVLKDKDEFANSFGEIKNCEKIICLNFKNNFSIPSCVYKLRKIIKEYNADLVHAHLFISTLIARLACPSDVKFVFTVHNVLSQDAFKANKLSKIAEKLLYQKRQKIIFVSDAALKDYDAHIGIKGDSIVLYNFIEDIFFDNYLLRPALAVPLKLVAVGNLREQKNYSYLLEVFRNFSPDQVTLDIYGDGPLKGELQSYIDKYNLPVRLLGRHGNIPEILKKYDAFVMASLYEGFGIALVEAMATGLPLIVSDIEVFKEVTGSHAIFFDPRDVESLTIKIRGILARDIDLSKLSGEGFIRAKEIGDKTKYIAKLLEIYSS
jgi:glycosyltransferase involved in cell wall biosynthesis